MIKPSKAEIKKRDREFQIAVINRDGECLRCHNENIEILSAHHIFTRGELYLRWDIKNGVTVCVECHEWAKRNPRESEKLFIGLLNLRYYYWKGFEEWVRYRQKKRYPNKV